MIDTNVFEFKRGIVADNTTQLFFKGPRDLVAEDCPEAETAEISIEFLTDVPIGANAIATMSPVIDGKADDWDDAQHLLTDQNLDDLISIGLKLL